MCPGKRIDCTIPKHTLAEYSIVDDSLFLLLRHLKLREKEREEVMREEVTRHG